MKNEIIVTLRKILGRSKAILTSREQANPRIELYRVQLAGLSESDSVSLMRDVARLRGIERVQSAAYDFVYFCKRHMPEFAADTSQDRKQRL